METSSPSSRASGGRAGLWGYGHLPLLVQSSSKESVEYLLQALWRTRKTGLDAADRRVICDMLHLSDDSQLDPLLVCLRILIRKCVYEDISKDEIQKLFPQEVLPELQKLLALLLQKFQQEWRDDVRKDQVTLPRLKAMTWNMVNRDQDINEHAAIVNLKLQGDEKSLWANRGRIPIRKRYFGNNAQVNDDTSNGDIRGPDANAS